MDSSSIWLLERRHLLRIWARGRDSNGSVVGDTRIGVTEIIAASWLDVPSRRKLGYSIIDELYLHYDGSLFYGVNEQGIE